MKARTEYFQQAFKAVISNNVNPKVFDHNWLNSFTVHKLVKREIFSELYLIQFKNCPEMRLLRKIKKIVFNNNLGGIEDFRFTLDELT